MEKGDYAQIKGGKIHIIYDTFLGWKRNHMAMTECGLESDSFQKIENPNPDNICKTCKNCLIRR